MNTTVCSHPECNGNAIFFTYPVCNREIYHPAAYCAEHAEVFLRNYHSRELYCSGAASSWRDAVAFEVELLVGDGRAEGHCYMYLREVGGRRRLDCQIGPVETEMIKMELERFAFPRPPTHRAMASVIQALHGRLEHVVIDQLSGHTYKAKLHIRQSRRTAIVDVRPSDAVVLAIVCDVPIYVSESVLAALGHA